MKSLTAIALAIAAGIGLGQCQGARAHDPYTGLTNPVTGISCCSGGPTGDCKAVDPREIGEDGLGHLSTEGVATRLGLRRGSADERRGGVPARPE